MGPEPLPLQPAAIDALQHIATATITTVLLKKGLRNVWLRGTAHSHRTPRIAAAHSQCASAAREYLRRRPRVRAISTRSASIDALLLHRVF